MGTEQTTGTIPRDKLPPGGIEGLLHTLDHPDPEGRTDDERLRDTTTREFQLIGLLGKCPTVDETLMATLDNQAGSSFFKLQGGPKAAEVRCPIGTLQLETNGVGEVGRLTTTLTTTSPNEALATFIAGVTPMIDFLSYRADTPVTLDRVQCRDARNLLVVVTYVSPHHSQIINPHEAELWSEMLPIYALYREAKNNPSNYYRLLCFFKILDAIYKHLRRDLRKRAKEQGISILIAPEVVPTHPEIVNFDKEFCGQPVHDVYNRLLRKEYRNAVAHFLTDETAPLNVSDYRTSSRFANIILLAEQCCRAVVETQEDAYRQFYAAGGKR